ncbi:sialic acid-binding Ig-like lectin 15 isoform 1-T1 [Sarcophilus harrisii]
MRWIFGLLVFLVCLVRMGVPSHKWSMQVPSDVTGEAGGGVVLLCTFTHPHKYYDGMITVIWRIREPYNGSQVFRCVVHSSSDHCQTAVSYKGKYKLLGNPRHNNISIRIDNLTWADGNRYFCRVEFAGDIHDRYESRSGIRLHVIEWEAVPSLHASFDLGGFPPAAPRIVNITVLPGPDHVFSARCTAEGEPLPSLIWTGPSAGNSTSTYSQSHQITKELHALAQDGRYTCTAFNSLGKAEGSVYFYKFRAASDTSVLLTLLFALGIKLLLLLVILGAVVYQRKVHSTAQETLSRRPQVQESNYENLNHGNNRAPPTTAATQ